MVFDAFDITNYYQYTCSEVMKPLAVAHESQSDITMRQTAAWESSLSKIIMSPSIIGCSFDGDRSPQIKQV
jgi:hypothetical protein